MLMDPRRLTGVSPGDCVSLRRDLPALDGMPTVIELITHSSREGILAINF
jgi:hypothetical protein